MYIYIYDWIFFTVEIRHIRCCNKRWFNGTSAIASLHTFASHIEKKKSPLHNEKCLSRSRSVEASNSLALGRSHDGGGGREPRA